jgi:hypothetical protein
MKFYFDAGNQAWDIRGSEIVGDSAWSLDPNPLLLCRSHNFMDSIGHHTVETLIRLRVHVTLLRATTDFVNCNLKHLVSARKLPLVQKILEDVRATWLPRGGVRFYPYSRISHALYSFR